MSNALAPLSTAVGLALQAKGLLLATAESCTGGVPGKPVGTVCFGWAMDGRVQTQRLVFAGDRQAVREQAVAHALRELLRFIQ